MTTKSSSLSHFPSLHQFFAFFVFTLTSLLTFANILYSSSVHADAAVQLRYWPKVNMGLGHVALFITPAQNAQPIYISYAMGNSQMGDSEDFGNDFTTLELKPVTDDKYEEFLTWFKATEFSHPESFEYGETYSLVSQNCAHVVLKSLKALGYRTRYWTGQWALTPGSVYREAKRFNK
jgi:hypothetical protein